MGDQGPVLGDTEGFTVEDWRRTYPMDYYKAFDIILQSTSDAGRDYAMQQIFSVCKLHIPDTLFKYYSLSDDATHNNEMKIDTLSKSQVYAAQIGTLNDPFDCRSAYYRPDALMRILGYDPVKAVGDMAS